MTAVQTFKKIEKQASVPRVATAAAVVDETNYTRPGITREYLLGGKATFRVTNKVTDESLTFKVRRARKEWPKDSGTYVDTWFVNVKVPGGRFPYRYIGIMNPETGTIKTTAMSAFLPGSKEYQTGAWATNVVLTEKLISPTYVIEHQGKCGRCAKPLVSSEHARGVHDSCD